MKTKFIRIFVNLLGAMIIVVQSGGCSVYFAASGSKDPDFSKVEPGSSRLVVEGELGSPTEEKIRAGGESALYTYKIGDHAAPGRAVLYLLGDIVTLCLAEYIFFPLEIAQSGNVHQVAVDYGANGQALKVRRIDNNTQSPL